MVSSRNGHRILVAKSLPKQPNGRPRRRWDDNIKMDPREIRCEDLRWVELAQGRVQWQALALVVLNVIVGLPESWLV
jgi:hypothetical protein